MPMVHCVVVVCWRLQKLCRCWCALFLWWTVLVDMLLYYVYGVDWQLLRRRSFFLWNQATDAPPKLFRAISNSTLLQNLGI